MTHDSFGEGLIFRYLQFVTSKIYSYQVAMKITLWGWRGGSVIKSILFPENPNEVEI